MSIKINKLTSSSNSIPSSYSYPMLMMIVPQLNELLFLFFFVFRILFSVVLLSFSHRSNIGLRLIWLHTHKQKKKEGLFSHRTHHFISKKIYWHRRKKELRLEAKRNSWLNTSINQNRIEINELLTRTKNSDAYRMSGLLKFKRLTYLYLEFINLIINFNIAILFFQNFYITILFTLKTHYSIFILLLYNLECYHYHQQFSIVALEENYGTEEKKKI